MSLKKIHSFVGHVDVADDNKQQTRYRRDLNLIQKKVGGQKSWKFSVFFQKIFFKKAPKW